MKNRIKELRNKKRLSQRELADKTGISQPLISRCEKGFENSKKTTWQVLADFFDVSVPYLQGYLIAECRWCGNTFVLTSEKDKDRYFYCPYCGRSPLTFKTK
jgi:transcriptional regulator with XRE-family HTH domain